jgi:hypothetical protein
LPLPTLPVALPPQAAGGLSSATDLGGSTGVGGSTDGPWYPGRQHGTGTASNGDEPGLAGLAGDTSSASNAVASTGLGGIHEGTTFDLGTQGVGLGFEDFQWNSMGTGADVGFQDDGIMSFLNDLFPP